MEKIENFGKGWHYYTENGLFIVLLAFYPLIHFNQGLDVSDTSYSLVNFQYFPSADGTWMVATYLANAAGWLLTKLPKGDSLVGMNFYTGLIVSFFALLCYFILRKKMPAWIVFTGEMLAIGLCWCPTVILYNYLTYVLMGLGILLLHKGICTKDEDSARRYLLFAGVCLGANVAVRMPNVLQAAFILGLWYGRWLDKEPLSRTIHDTGVSILGYLVGFGIPFLSICKKYGWGAYPAMVGELFAMTDKAVDYQPLSMLTGMFGDYWSGLYWLAFAAVCVSGFYGLYWINDSLRKQKSPWLYRILCAVVCGVLVRFYWGRGMFEFQYYNYRGIYQWAVLFLLLTIFCAVAVLLSTRSSLEEKTFALLMLLQLLITPIGSNNALYPIINNLFLAAPFTLWTIWRAYSLTRDKENHFPWKIMVLAICVMMLIQSVAFHFQFVFLDGVWGEKRDTLLTEVPKAEGIYTNRENAELLSELARYAKEQELAGREVILYGEIPGLSYFLDMPPAISTSWPDLDSYRMARFEQDMELVAEQKPVVIVSAAIAAYRGEDAKAYQWFGVDEEKYDADEKLQLLLRFLDTYDYQETFCNMRYAVYEAL
ncbi:MAG: hypothetical protein NC318_09080 [Blautia sp.]|nr:hypothetical protein [Lachnoclostridium sp.]MCM1211743.1 hypothetical protein [Blautia sp.]